MNTDAELARISAAKSSAASATAECSSGTIPVLIYAHRRASLHAGVGWCTRSATRAQTPATAQVSPSGRREMRPCLKLFGGQLDVVALQAAVELKPRDAEELGGARLVAMRALERVDDRLALELLQPHGAGGRPHRFGRPR